MAGWIKYAQPSPKPPTKQPKEKTMACEICGKNSCTRSFHSIEVQESFDEIADNVKDRMRSTLKNRIDRLEDRNPEGSCTVDLLEVLQIIDNY